MKTDSMDALSPHLNGAVLQFTLSGLVVPKARPQFNQGQAYLPSTYRIWKEQAIVELLQQKQKVSTDYPIPFPIKLHIIYQGTANADADNIAGSIMDALRYAKIIKNDNLKHVQQLILEFIPTPKKQAQALIKIMPANTATYNHSHKSLKSQSKQLKTKT
jgi:Holliday junction resolvase RusA-like endonuclease